MQRLFSFFLTWLAALAALYVSGFACATDGPALAGESKPVPHIALLLPLKSTPFAPAAQAVQQGFLAAANLEPAGTPGKLPVRVYGYADESREVSALYRQAIAEGARAVVGPLTRNGVMALAAERVSVPTLALNNIERETNGQLYLFGMEAEAEARLIARLARQQGLQQAIVIATAAPLSQRLQFAFEEEWHSAGGTIQREFQFNDNPAALADLGTRPDTMVFLAADIEQARLIRPYLPGQLPVYATSQIFGGNNATLANYDLDGIHFVDMPWLLQADDPAVVSHPRANPPLPVDLDRFYALGIDAFRLIQLLLADDVAAATPLDGVTGQIYLRGHTFRRTALEAQFVHGRAHLPGTPLEPAPSMFPAPPATSAPLAVSAPPATKP
ncbi:MAG TPA: penicillin-binding protein activator [Gallionella sp.]|nr:penicillin-binding protein activator [Gallionella sp.]